MLTPRDEFLIDLGCYSLRLKATDQAQRLAWPGSSRDACSKRLHLLQKRGWYTKLVLPLIPPLPTEDGPRICWQPGQSLPTGLGAKAYRGEQHYKTTPLELITIWLATKQAAGVFGGKPGKMSRLIEASHDLHLAEVVVHKFLTGRKHEVAQLVKEDLFIEPPERFAKRPDSRIHVDRNPALKPLLIVESGGAYDRRRLQAFCDYYCRFPVPFEVW